jgi:hypothetical protein
VFEYIISHTYAKILQVLAESAPHINGMLEMRTLKAFFPKMS